MSSKYDLESRDPVSSQFAFEAFSKAGFKTIPAISEIIDNSIEANSNNIIIKFEWKELPTTRRNRRVEKFVFIDDGDGMDKRKLYDYFIAAESDKRNNSSGIGKFGVGAYMACISQAKKGEVYSKTKGGEWFYTILDTEKKIPKPITKDPPKEYMKFECGTIVIWSNSYSKFTENNIDADKDKESLRHELGRIYRKFITKEKVIPSENGSIIVKNENIIKIKIDNGSQILDIIPYDPLFLTYNQKEDDKEKPETVSQRIKLTTEDYSGFMIITYSKFPDSWWVEDYRPGNIDVNTTQRKISERDEGISLVREGRELYFGKHPGGPIKILRASDAPGKRSYFEKQDRWTGIEVEFTRESDDIFGVEFNKTRILMEKFVRDKISEAISPTIVSRRNYFSSERNLYKHSKENIKTGGLKGTKIIQEKTNKHNQPQDTETERKLREFAERYKDSIEDTDDVIQDLLKGYHISLGYKLDPNGPFVSFAYEADSVLVKYNMEHPFMKRFFEILEKIGLKLGAEPANAGKLDEIQTLRALLDILIASFGFSKTRFKDITESQEIETTLNELITHWGISAYTLADSDIESE